MAWRKKKAGKMGGGCLILFGIPFAAAGIFFASSFLSMILTWHNMQSWEEAPARILDAELITNSDSDGDTYRVEARYQYEYSGATYVGTRVTIESESDNIGSFHHDVYEELSSYQDSGELFRCYVNPENPHESVLYRDLRWRMVIVQSLFAVVFTGAGMGVIIGGFWAWKKKHRAKKRLSGHPNKPWLEKQEWAEGIIRSRMGIGVLVLAGFALFWNLLSWSFVAIMGPDLWKEKSGFFWLLLLFPAIGLLMIAGVIYGWIRWKKYGKSMFRMASVPGVIGGKLAGVVYAPNTLSAPQGFDLSLSCLEKTTDGDGDSSEEIVWQDTKHITHGLLKGREADEGAAIPVLFQIPYEAKPSTTSVDEGDIKWRLEVNAKTPGIDYAASFDVPVFKTEESDPNFVLDEAPIAQFVENPEPIVVLAETGIEFTPLPGGGVEVNLPAGRQKKAAVFMTLFFVIWTGAVIFMFKTGAPIPFAILFGLFDLPIFWGVLWYWFGASRIRVEYDTLTLTKSILAIGRTRQIQISEIESVFPKMRSQTNNTAAYGVMVKTVSGKEYTAVFELGSLPLAKMFAAELERAMGLE